MDAPYDDVSVADVLNLLYAARDNYNVSEHTWTMFQDEIEKLKSNAALVRNQRAFRASRNESLGLSTR